MKLYNLKTERKSVNTKRLADEIDTCLQEAMSDIFRDPDNWSGKDWFIDLTEDLLSELAETGQIDQWDVVCDSRNNKTSKMRAGQLNVIVAYRQSDCVNTTQLLYTLSIKKDDDTAEEIELEF